MFCLNHRSIKVTLFSEIHIKIISKISLTYHQIAFYFLLKYKIGVSQFYRSVNCDTPINAFLSMGKFQ